LKFLDRFSKNTQTSNFVETPSSRSLIVPFERTDGYFPQFAKPSEKGKDVIPNPMKPCGGSRSLTTEIGGVEGSGVEWSGVVNFVPWSLYPWERTSVSIE
jgi:hypothetical protein